MSILFDVEETSAALQKEIVLKGIDVSDYARAHQFLAQFIVECGSGFRGCNGFVLKNLPVQATIAATGTSVVATDTIVIAGVTLTCVNSGATANEWNKGASDAATMANLVSKINGHATLSLLVTTAVTSGSTISITAAKPGILGNAITVSSSGGTIAFAGSATRLAGGSEGTETTVVAPGY
jgi:hypothetical protein